MQFLIFKYNINPVLKETKKTKTLKKKIKSVCSYIFGDAVPRSGHKFWWLDFL